MDATTHELLEAVRINVASLPIATAEGRGAVAAALDSLSTLRAHLDGLQGDLQDPFEPPEALETQTETFGTGDVFTAVAEPVLQTA